MKQHRHFEDELDRLKQCLVEMAGLAESQVDRAVQSLLERDTAKADAVIRGDARIDDLELEVDDQAMRLLALQQPMARDLRFITLAMTIGNDLERVGDHAVNIAENVGYRQISIYWRLRGMISKLRGAHAWGAMERKGFATSVPKGGPAS